MLYIKSRNATTPAKGNGGGGEIRYEESRGGAGLKTRPYYYMYICVSIYLMLYKKAKRDSLLRQQKAMEEEAKAAERRAEAEQV